ncbi:hypothetical protein BCV70DRAFT_154778 [Testicularia cyperi]|uniref:N-acetylgalactosaminide beta-1,3-galactosyltransferase n=1 Tax=Testicularia cyperi TaxID=1882483 RepID=A0A317Y0R4_9BASI|nr:hypothetical protein BCV70DRAFT_154778 [Testicularia cyperi]
MWARADERAELAFQDGKPLRPTGIAAKLLDRVKRFKTHILVALCVLLTCVLLFDRSKSLSSSGSTSALASYSPYAPPVSSSSLGGVFRRPEDDILLITKVGASTVHKRLMIHLAEQPLSNLYIPNKFYVSDWPVKLGPIEFYDALANVSDTVKELDEFKHLRHEMSALLQSNQDLDDMSEKDGGWKLDKYKFLPMMGEAYRRFPNVKWYVMVEADTFLFWNQLVKWLATLNENKQLLIGHPSFCDYDGKSTMFTHGGSGIVMSKGLIEATYGQDPEYEHNHDELIKKSAFGDALLSKSFYDAPKVHLTELSKEGGEKFNSDPPRILKFLRSNWCTPIMTFHHVTPADTAHLYEFQRRIEPRLGAKDMIKWADVWDEFQPEFLRKAMIEVANAKEDPTTFQHDDPNVEPGEVGVVAWQAIEDWDSETSDTHTATAKECQTVCRSHDDCLMWSWDPESDKDKDKDRNRDRGLCRWTSEFLRIGVTKPSKTKLTTGWMAKRINHWRSSFGCSGHSGIDGDF